MVAAGGLLAMAAAMGIGRFVYTPILPAMIAALGWSKVDAGLVASANFLGYMLGALMVGGAVFAAAPRRWLLVALAVSASTTAAMGVFDQLYVLMVLRFVGGIASAFVIVCSSTLVLERLALAGQENLAAIHFAGVGAGIAVSALIVGALATGGVSWQGLWLASGLAAVAASILAVRLIPDVVRRAGATVSRSASASTRPLIGLALAHGLFGFGYVITATFLVTIVRETPSIRPFEPWVWVIVGLATIPSVTLWQWLGRRIGLLRAYAVACLVEALGVAASVEWVSITGACVSAILLGGTFMGLTALGLMAARTLGGAQAQRAIGLTTASFGLGQMIGPTVAGILSEASGSLRSASLLAAAVLIVGAGLAFASALLEARDQTPAVVR